jgi:hypothetical protein
LILEQIIELWFDPLNNPSVYLEQCLKKRSVLYPRSNGPRFQATFSGGGFFALDGRQGHFGLGIGTLLFALTAHVSSFPIVPT